MLVDVIARGSDVQGGGGRLFVQQAELVGDRAVVDRYAEAMNVDEFGAVWFDNEPDPVEHVLAVTTRADEHAALLRPLLEHPERFRVVDVKRSERALQALQDEVRGLSPEYPISMIAADVPNGVVVVGLSRDDDDVRTELRRRFGAAIRVEPFTSIIRRDSAARALKARSGHPRSAAVQPSVQTSVKALTRRTR
jgi:hypothetical protein